jgi:hypothetical protein
MKTTILRILRDVKDRSLRAEQKSAGEICDILLKFSTWCIFSVAYIEARNVYSYIQENKDFQTVEGLFKYWSENIKEVNQEQQKQENI